MSRSIKSSGHCLHVPSIPAGHGQNARKHFCRKLSPLLDLSATQIAFPCFNYDEQILSHRELELQNDNTVSDYHLIDGSKRCSLSKRMATTWRCKSDPSTRWAP